MIKKHKKQLILSSLVILLPTVIGLFLWNDLPAQIGTHWGLQGQTNGWSSKPFTVFGLPIILLLFHWICIYFTLLDPRNKEQNIKVFNMVLWIMPVISLLSATFVYAIALGKDINIDMLTRLLLALIFIIMGNYLPKCKQNRTIGIKVTWTLRNEENWNKTHRLAGKLWFVGGFLLLATLMIPLKSFSVIFILLLIIMVATPIIYSYVYYRKQLRLGTATVEDSKMTPDEKKATKASILILIITLTIVILAFLKGDFEIIYEDTSFTVDASLWYDAKVNYEDIESIAYCEKNAPGIRNFGYGTPSITMGECQNSAFGNYTGYYYSSCDFWVVLQVDGKTFTLNGKDEAATKAIYGELLQRTGK